MTAPKNRRALWGSALGVRDVDNGVYTIQLSGKVVGRRRCEVDAVLSREDHGLMAKLLQPGDHGSADQPGAACYRNAHVHLLTGEISRSRGRIPATLSREAGERGSARC